MHAALNLLRQEFDDNPISVPIVSMLQEVNLLDSQQIKASKWIQENSYIADVSKTTSAYERYRTATLVDKSLLIEQIFRVYYNSKPGWHAIFVDITVAPALERSLTTKAESCLKTLRVGNASGVPFRQSPSPLILVCGFDSPSQSTPSTRGNFS
jgi:hypothetical protein